MRGSAGTNLLKHTRFGHPHLRQFQLSTDRQRLLWYTANKGKKASVVKWHELEGLVLGQKSANFEAYRIPALQHLSFSLVFKQEQGFAELAAAATPANAAAAVVLPPAWLESAPKTLDLTCKDEVEFDFWVAGCKALIASAKGIRLSKLQLLSHSRRFLSVPPVKGTFCLPLLFSFPLFLPLSLSLSVSLSVSVSTSASCCFPACLRPLPSPFASLKAQLLPMLLVALLLP